MIIKTFSELESEEIEKLFRFSHTFQPYGFYDNTGGQKNMVDYLGGALLNHGDHHLSCWKEGQPVASVGWIDRELESKKELYLTHGFSSVDGLAETSGTSCWQQMLDRIGSQLPTGELLIKLGVRGHHNPLQKWVVEHNWAPLYNMLKMSRKLDHRVDQTEQMEQMEQIEQIERMEQQSDESFNLDICNRMILEDLRSNTWTMFMDIHNGGFEQVPNGGLLDHSERDDLMETYRKNQGRLLLGRVNGEPVAIAMLKRGEGTMELEAISVDPTHHGKGYGRSMLRALYRLLQTEEPDLRQLDLMVMDANVRAYELYKREGFVLDRVEVCWYAHKR